jgi:hypothetical protein
MGDNQQVFTREDVAIPANTVRSPYLAILDIITPGLPA